MICLMWKTLLSALIALSISSEICPYLVHKQQLFYSKTKHNKRNVIYNEMLRDDTRRSSIPTLEGANGKTLAFDLVFEVDE